jgi:hypothetical protein
MIFKSSIISAGSGSVGGLTLSRNRGGMYLRARATPTNPNTPAQQAVKSAMGQLASLWRNVLTDDQRKAWDLYAENVPLPNPLGDPRNVGGLGMYVRSNVIRIASGVAGLVRVDDAPIIFNLGDVGVITVITATAATDVVSMGFDDNDEWVDEDAAALLIYTAKAQNPSINYFKGPYGFAGAVEGDSGSPPSTPAAIDAAFNIDVDNKTFVFARVSRADGRLSTPFRGFGLGV